MDRISSIWSPIRETLEVPFNLLLNAINLQLGGLWYLIYDVLAVIAVILVVRWALVTGLGFFKKDSLSDQADIDALIKVHGDLETALQDSSTLRATTAFLKKNKQWDRLGLVYASLNNHKEAAKYFKKAGDLKMAADQLSKAGLTVKSAQMLMKAGEFDEAGRFFMKAEKYPAAAKAFTKAGNSASAGAAYGKAGKYKQAVELFREYFQAPREDAAGQARAAMACYQLLSDENAQGKIPEEDTKALLRPIARAFEQEKRFDLSADLYRRAGELVRAAEVYVLAGKLQEAGACYNEAGRPKDAARIGGRFYEKKGRWKEAGMAYAGAEEFLKAGECFSKAKEPVRAAEFFEKAGAHSRAGLMYAQGQRYENAVQMLQKVSEEDKEFDISRALLGRSFYELHDYAHCAATLENHLLGKRIDKANIDYFYMLALAKEQLGLLEESKDILYKIG
ncbi:MAG: tetratricopeptide repeat protein, partial [Candidatus Hydrogenedentes bacterium]|nr:tetratricopeptide repeat protein [Candidatus Hydrogenedentota bacterium]